MKPDVKICGLKNVAAMEAALAGGATHVGLVFFPASPRNLSIAAAAELRRIASGRAKVVAVVVDPSDSLLDGIMRKVQPDMLQLHGSETPGRVEEIRKRHAIPVMKALPVRDRADLDAVDDYLGIADRLLFDAKAPKGAALPGGRGEAFDWNLLGDLDPGMDYMLSGGLHAGNIAAALSIATPGGIDISSGVESAPGEKSLQRISEFFAALAAATGARCQQATGKG